MPLTPGTRLGPYAITAALGVGGVRRANDLTLKRDMAIKVLPEYWSRDPERLCRFEKEAQATAALSQRNILYDGSPYIVTELLQGETLRDNLQPVQLTNGPLSYETEVPSRYGNRIFAMGRRNRGEWSGST